MSYFMVPKSIFCTKNLLLYMYWWNKNSFKIRLTAKRWELRLKIQVALVTRTIENWDQSLKKLKTFIALLFYRLYLVLVFFLGSFPITKPIFVAFRKIFQPFFRFKAVFNQFSEKNSPISKIFIFPQKLFLRLRTIFSYQFGPFDLRKKWS